MITQRPRLDMRVSWAWCEVVFWKYEKLEKGEVEQNKVEQLNRGGRTLYTGAKGTICRQNFKRVCKKESVRGLNELIWNLWYFVEYG